ncbi:MAG: mechanosensitive ion channel family protein [Muribaculaceae bacterium]|nr:mechanosensitive ion channel family protein [Muribaculaceae bacterium]
MIKTHQLATWLLHVIDSTLDYFGFGRSAAVEDIIYFIIVVLIALGFGTLLRRIVLWAVRRWVRMRHTVWGEELLAAHTLQKCSHVVPPLVLMGFVPFLFEQESAWHTAVLRAVILYLIATMCYGINGVLRFLWRHYDTHDNTRHLPLKGILNVAEGLVWIVAVILAFAVILGRSPMALLGGLGACAAVIMLIFKDSILGFVAGIQLSLNDMLHVGDWITVPGTPADGVVTDVTISVVKVQNFDNTMIMLPPYSLVSGSFQNWKGMSDSGMRRIARNILIDASSVTGGDPDSSTDPMSTNLGKFRAYCLQYLQNHPHITKNGLIMVRLMAQTDAGLPLQMWCFTDTTDWPTYESIQSQIFEHLTAVAADFGLRIYNLPATLSIPQPQPKA